MGGELIWEGWAAAEWGGFGYGVRVVLIFDEGPTGYGSTIKRHDVKLTGRTSHGCNHMGCLCNEKVTAKSGPYIRTRCWIRHTAPKLDACTQLRMLANERNRGRERDANA